MKKLGLKIKKIKDKNVNLEVRGQGCWDDCTVYGHWENNVDKKNCVWIEPHTSPLTKVFM